MHIIVVLLRVMLRVLCFSSLMFLVGCSTLTDWFGEAKERVEGERLPVLAFENSLRISDSLQETSMSLSPMQATSQWNKSHGFTPSASPHPKGPAIIGGMDAHLIGYPPEAYRLKSTPVLANGKAYMMDGRGYVRAIDAGEPFTSHWSYHIPGSDIFGDLPSSYLTYSSGRIFVSAGSETLFALDAETGQLLWKRSLAHMIRTAPGATDEYVAVMTSANILYLLDAQTGAIAWTHEGIKENITLFGSASPIIVDDKVLASYSSGDVTALQLRNGRPIWSYNVSAKKSTATLSLGDIYASPVVHRGRVYAMSQEGYLAAIDLATGSPIWELPISSMHTPWVSGDFVFVLDQQETLYAVHSGTGAIKWHVKMSHYSDSESIRLPKNIQWYGPSLAGGSVIMIGHKGILLRVDPQTGAMKDFYHIPKGIYSRPAIANNRMAMLNEDGQLVVIAGQSDRK